MIKRYGIAALCVAAGVTIRIGFDPFLSKTEPLIILMLAILVAVRLAGRGPGIFATFLGAFSAWFFFIEPRYSLRIADLRDLGSLALMIAGGIGISFIAEGVPRQASAIGDAAVPTRAKASFWRRLRLGSAAIVVLIAMIRVLYSDFEREQERQHWISRTYQAIGDGQKLLASLTDAETAQRGYLLTGDKSYLGPYESAVRMQGPLRKSLRALTADDASQQIRLAAVDRFADDKLAEIRETIERYGRGERNAAIELVRSGQGKWSMDTFRALITGVEDEQRAMLARRTADLEAQTRQMRWVLGLGGGTLLLLLVVAGVVIEQDFGKGEAARQAVFESERRLHQALGAAKAGAWAWDVHTNECVWSEEMWELLGLAPLSCPPSYESWRAAIHADDRDTVDQAMKRAAGLGGEMSVEYRVTASEGGERWLAAMAQPQLDEAGRLKRYRGIVLDISQRKQAERVLREQRSRLEQISAALDMSHSMVRTLDGTIVYWSRGAAAMYGWTGEEAVGKRSHDLLKSEFPVPLGDIQRELMGSGEWEGELRHHRRDGGTVVVASHWSLAHDAEGRNAAVVEVNNDITQLQLAREELRESEAQFRTLANAIPQLCWMANADGWIFWYNQRWYDYTGTTPEQMEGWGWQAVHDPKVLPSVMERWQASIGTGKPFEMVFPLRAASGEFRPFLTRIVPVTDHDGRVARWFGTNTDITEQLRAEHELRESQERLSYALAASNIGHWELNLADHTCRRSPEHGRIFGYTGLLPDWTFERFLEHIVPEDRAAIHAEFLAAAQARRNVRFECRIARADGAIRWIWSCGEHRWDEPGRPPLLVGIVQDITERKEADEHIRRLNAELEQRVVERTAQLEASNKELEAFAYSVSHDLRAPLRGIDGWSMALMEDYAAALDQQAHGYLQQVRSETQRMGMLIDDLLQLSRITRSELEREPVDLTGLAQSVAKRLVERHPDRRIDFSIGPGLTAEGDARLLEIALMNILENAVKFTGRRKEAFIEVGSTPHDGTPAFYVRDNGAGFDMAYAATLFGAFQRLHKPTEFPGTGIGLATAQRIIRRHGGRIWAEAQPDCGATFYFTIGSTT